MRHGYWGMVCWNALSEAQQERLIVRGNLEIGYRAEGTACDRDAELCIETQYDKAPGPRFYCIPCAIEFLRTLEGSGNEQARLDVE